MDVAFGRLVQSRVVVADEMRQHLGIGGGLEGVARLGIALLEPFEVFNHTVVDDRDPRVLVQMGV